MISNLIKVTATAIKGLTSQTLQLILALPFSFTTLWDKPTISFIKLLPQLDGLEWDLVKWDMKLDWKAS